MQNGLKRGDLVTLKLPDDIRKSIKAGALHPHLLIYDKRQVTIKTLEKGKCKIFECDSVWIPQKWLVGYSNYYDYLEWATRPDEKEFVDPRRPKEKLIKKEPVRTQIKNTNGVVEYRDLQIDDEIEVCISPLTRKLIELRLLSKRLLLFNGHVRRIVEIGKSEIKLFGTGLWFPERDFVEYNAYLDYLQRKENEMFKVEKGVEYTPAAKKLYIAQGSKYPFDELDEPELNKDGKYDYSSFPVEEKYKNATIAAAKKYMKDNKYKRVLDWLPEGKGCRIFRLKDREDGEVIILRTGFRGSVRREYKIGEGFIENEKTDDAARK